MRKVKVGLSSRPAKRTLDLRLVVLGELAGEGRRDTRILAQGQDALPHRRVGHMGTAGRVAGHLVRELADAVLGAVLAHHVEPSRIDELEEASGAAGRY